MTTTIVCPATSQLSENDLDTLSLVFPASTRIQLIKLRQLLNNRNASFRAYSSGVVTFDNDALFKEVAFTCSNKTAERLAHLVERGVCLQAIATANLKMPLTGTDPISLKD